MLSEETRQALAAQRQQMQASLAEVIRQAKAEAWDEGYQDGYRQPGEGEDGPKYTNPYRGGSDD